MFLDSILSSGRFPVPVIGLGHGDDVSSKTKARKPRGHKAQQRAKLAIKVGEVSLLDALPCASRYVIVC